MLARYVVLEEGQPSTEHPSLLAAFRAVLARVERGQAVRATITGGESPDGGRVAFWEPAMIAACPD